MAGSGGKRSKDLQQTGVSPRLREVSANSTNACRGGKELTCRIPDVMEGCNEGRKESLSNCLGCSNSNAEKDVS